MHYCNSGPKGNFKFYRKNNLFKVYILNGTEIVDDTFSLCSYFNYYKLQQKILEKPTVLITIATKYYTFEYDIV